MFVQVLPWERIEEYHPWVDHLWRESFAVLVRHQSENTVGIWRFRHLILGQVRPRVFCLDVWQWLPHVSISHTGYGPKTPKLTRYWCHDCKYPEWFQDMKKSSGGIQHFIQIRGRQCQDDAKLIERVRHLADIFLNSSLSGHPLAFQQVLNT